MPDGFLHLTDPEDGTPVRIRISKIDALYVMDDSEEITNYGGQTIAVRERTPYTVVGYGESGLCHNVAETIEQIETQISDFFELAGIAAL